MTGPDGPGWPASPGQWLDGVLAMPAQLARIIEQNERLITMAGESQAALAELSNAVTVEMEEYATRNEALETQVRGLLDELGATREQVASLDLTIAQSIRAAIPRIQGIVPNTPEGGGTEGGGTEPTPADNA